MKNSDIILLTNAGIQLATAHDAEPEYKYALFILRKEIDTAAMSIIEKDKALMKECGIEDGKKYQTTSPEVQEHAKLYEKLMSDETPISGIKTVPYEVWCEMQKENRDKELKGRKMDILSGKVEIILEGIFWEHPKARTEKAQKRR